MKFNLLRFLLCIVLCISLFLIIGFTAAELITRDDGFFERQYEKNHVSENTQISDSDLCIITQAMQDYLMGKREDLIVKANIKGEYKEVFSPDELSHMKDVKDVFFLLSVLRSACVVALIAIMIYCAAAKESLSRMLYISSGAVLVFMAIIGAGVALSFNALFTFFHKIFFTGDTWLFDPDVSVLINLVPEGFFVASAVRLVLISAAALIVIFLFNFIYYKSKRSSL